MFVDYSDCAATANDEAIRDRNQIEGRACHVCPTGVTEPGEEICPDCTADETADITHEIMEALKDAA